MAAGELDAAAAPARARWVRPLGVLVLTTLVAVQAWPWFVAPLLPFEDGAVLFAGNYARFDPANCFASYGGYVAFGSNLLAALCCRLPVGWIPAAFVAAAAAVTVLAASALLHPAWRLLLPPAAQLAGALAVVMPLGSYLMLGSLAYAQWAMLWWLLIVMLHPERRGGIARAWEPLLVVGLAWSHPLAVLLLPFAAVARLRRVDARRWGVLGAAVAGYWTLLLSRGVPDVQAAARGPAAVSLDLLLTHGGLEALCGDVGSAWLRENGGPWAARAGGAAILAGAGWWGWRALRGAGAALRVRVAATAAFAVLVVLASACAREAAGGGAGWVVRYVWVLRVALVLALVCAAGWRGRGPWRGAALCAAVLALGAWLWRSNRGYYHHAGGAEFVRMLSDELAAQEQRLGGRAAVEAVLPRVQAAIVVRPR